MCPGFDSWQVHFLAPETLTQFYTQDTLGNNAHRGKKQARLESTFHPRWVALISVFFFLFFLIFFVVNQYLKGAERLSSLSIVSKNI